MFQSKKQSPASFFSVSLCILEVFLLFLTMIRLPFFIRIVKKNYFTQKHHTIRFRKCVHIAFMEMVKDLPFIVISAIIIILAPWRIRLLAQTLMNQQKRVPSFEHASKRINVPGKRKDILMVFWRVWSYDYMNIVMGIVLICSGYKLKEAFRLLSIGFSKLNNDFHFCDFDLRKALFQEIKSLYEDIKTGVYLIVIVGLGFRIRHCYRRILRLRRMKNIKYGMKTLQIKFDPNAKGSFSRAVSYNTFSIIAQFLDLKDLSNVSRVSKSLYNFVESERIWSDQFHINWKSKYIDDKILRSYKEKCKKAYHDSFDKSKWNEEKKDELLGYYHIIYEEYLESLFLIPHWILLPIKFLSFVFIKLDKLDNGLHWENRKYIPAAILCDLYKEAMDSMHFPIGNVDIMHLHSFLPFFLIKYFSKGIFLLSYFLMYPIFLTTKKLSAGNARRIELIIPDENNNEENFKNNIDTTEIVSQLPNRNKRIFLYFLQTITFPILVLYVLGIFLSGPLFYWLVLQGTWYQCLTGYYLSNIPLYLSALMILLTLNDISEGFPFYQPIECFKMLGDSIWATTKASWRVFSVFWGLPRPNDA